MALQLLVVKLEQGLRGKTDSTVHSTIPFFNTLKIWLDDIPLFVQLTLTDDGIVACGNKSVRAWPTPMPWIAQVSDIYDIGRIDAHKCAYFSAERILFADARKLAP